MTLHKPIRYAVTTYEAELRAEAVRRRAANVMVGILIVSWVFLAASLVGARHQIARLKGEVSFVR